MDTRKKSQNNASSGWSEDEKRAMKERADELKAARAPKSSANDEQAVLDKIAEMPEEDKAIALRLYALVKEKFQNLTFKTWYGMPAFYLNGRMLFFFQSGQRFGTRYCTLGFSDDAKLDQGSVWPTAYALTKLNPSDEPFILGLIEKAMETN